MRTGYTVHGRDHQQQALRSSVGAGQGAGLQRAVHCAGRAGLRLHLDQLYGLAKQVLLAVGSPRIHVVSHGAGRSDGVNGSYLSTYAAASLPSIVLNILFFAMNVIPPIFLPCIEHGGSPPFDVEPILGGSAY